jgi:RimJ/RimL family protein N-acetyltransferase
MVVELQPHQFIAVRPLFRGFDYSLSVHAAIEGNNPGRIFVDNIDHPNTALALTVEGYLLAGDSGSPEVIDAIRRLLREKIFSGEVYVNGNESLSLALHPEEWEARLPELIPTHEAEKLARYHYLCNSVQFNWRSQVPQGYKVKRVDEAFLNDPRVVFTEVDWFDFGQMWGSLGNFLEKGVGFCLMRGWDVIAWCMSDCVAGDQIDVGVFTHPAYRRRDLGTTVVAATVEHCLRQGFRSVGWHCNAENVGSWKLAEKVGFKRTRQYNYYYYMYDLIDHLAELGWYHYRQQRYDRCTQYYEQVFAQREDNPDYYYHLAASAWAILGDAQKAIHYLQAAVDHGWVEADFTKEAEEFAFLHGTPEWEALLKRMGSAEDEPYTLS